jgi:Mlc titration factor MtfA (ptsG expression regulator)
MIALILLIVLVVIGLKIYNRKAGVKFQLSFTTRQLLLNQVVFYRDLDEKQKQLFENRVEDFLQQVTITGVGVTVEDLDRILIASGAIIPIFAFPDWKYNNISEVLLYKDNFSADYKTEGKDRNILGMVGDGALHREMILSQPSVRSSFQNYTDGHNTVIHEFVHLIDKADGDVDGVPKYLLSRPYLLPWINRIHETIKEMKANERSDINLYGATNDAEFFAVVSEYFFERPDVLKTHHPELYSMLEQMFHSSSK